MLIVTNKKLTIYKISCANLNKNCKTHKSEIPNSEGKAPETVPLPVSQNLANSTLIPEKVWTRYKRRNLKKLIRMRIKFQRCRIFLRCRRVRWTEIQAISTIWTWSIFGKSLKKKKKTGRCSLNKQEGKMKSWRK